jgi:hypothetical protein
MVGAAPRRDGVDGEDKPEHVLCNRLKILPANVELTIKETYGGLDATDFAILRADSIPDASSRSPTEVLEYVRDTLGANRRQGYRRAGGKTGGRRRAGCGVKPEKSRLLRLFQTD